MLFNILYNVIYFWDCRSSYTGRLNEFKIPAIRSGENGNSDFSAVEFVLFSLVNKQYYTCIAMLTWILIQFRD